MKSRSATLQAEPAMPARQDEMAEMTELVEKRPDVVVRHQPRIAGLAAGEARDEHQFGKLTTGARPHGHGDRRVARLVRPRMQVEIEPPDHDAVPEHLERLDGRMPDRRVLRGAIGHAVEFRRDVEEALADKIEREVDAHRLRIEVVARLAHQLGV